jgi:hypothetical protein
MENIDNKQQNLAGKDMKAKKGWKRPELKELNIRMTNAGSPGQVFDGTTEALS